MRDADGNPIGMRGVTMDISARKRAEESLGLLLKVSELLADALEVEKSIASVLRLSVPSLAAWAAADVEEDDGKIRRIASIGNAIDAGEAASSWHRHTLARLDEGRVIVAPLVARGRVLGGLSFGRANAFSEPDVHLIELLARRTAVAIDNARLYSESRAANVAKDEFLASLSHELRTPMTATLGWISLMRMAEFDKEQLRDAINAIEASTRTQARLIEDLLDISRIVTGKIQVYNEVVDLASIARQAVEMTLPAARTKLIEIALDAPAEPLLLWGDGGRLKQVIWNLLSNAVKFTPAAGSVRIEVARESGAARVRVSDSGEGIAPEFLPLVFERFQQGSTGSNRRHGGLGLGLAIARSFVELHGGTIAVTSEGLGKGATFTVALPLSVAHQSPNAHESTTRPDLEGLHVLVVEDEDGTRLMLQQTLRAFGATVDVASTPVEALSMLAAKGPDVLVSDIGLPGLDGCALMMNIRSGTIRANIPAIALTAYTTPDDERRSLGAGYDSFLSKPVEPSALAQTILRLTK